MSHTQLNDPSITTTQNLDTSSQFEPPTQHNRPTMNPAMMSEIHNRGPKQVQLQTTTQNIDTNLDTSSPEFPTPEFPTQHNRPTMNPALLRDIQNNGK